jgi:methylmalonyl-CoA mutase
LRSDTSARVARNTQLILQEETGIPAAIDPFGGSYFMESLTAQLAEAARQLISEVEELGGMAKAIDAGMPKLRIEECAARRQARVDRGDDVIVGVNKYPSPGAEADIETFVVDNTAVREAQLKRLGEIRAKRDEAEVSQSLDTLEALARSGEGNLLEAAVVAAHARATIGEISDALERVYERHRPETRTLTGVYGSVSQGDEEFDAVRAEVDEFAKAEGRRPRMLVCKLGQDGHDRGMKVIASAFADLGFDVDIGPLFQMPGEAARQAIENDVHVVGVSTQAGGHKTLVPQLIEALKAQGARDIVIVVGGVIPPNDIGELVGAGASAVFGPGTPVPKAAREVLQAIRAKRSS